RKDSWLKEYVDFSSQTFRIELQYKKGEKPSQKEIMALFNKEDIQTLAMNVITYDGKLKNFKPEEIIKRFCDFRKTHLIRRFKRLSGLEEEKIERNSELIRFIKEKWNEKVIGIKSKKDFEEKLKASKFKYFEWLCTIPVYRMTIEEVKKCEEAIVEAKTTLARYQGLVKEDKKLTDFMVTELEELQNKWDKV
ncbi:DNA gyrase subunit A, partial [Leptospira santarosai]